MSANDIEELKSLTANLQQGLQFYQSAALRAELPEHRAIFERMRISREFALGYLESIVESGGEYTAHAFGSVLHKMYPDILFGLNQQFDTELVKESHQIELDTLRAMQHAFKHIENSTIQTVLVDLYPQINGKNNWDLDKAC